MNAESVGRMKRVTFRRQQVLSWSPRQLFGESVLLKSVWNLFCVELARELSMRHRLFYGSAALLAMSVAPNLHAQDTGAITGTVRDNTGAVIQGADVKISGTA